MKPLPATRYEYAEWIKAKVGVDITSKQIDTITACRTTGRRARSGANGRLDDRMLVQGRAHRRTRAQLLKGKHTTLAEHMPSSHRKHMRLTPGRLLNWGQNIGTGTHAAVQWQLENHPHPEQGYRACLGLLNLSKIYGEQRLEAACRRTIAIGSPTRKRIIAILKAKLDQNPDLFPATDTAAATASRTHSNVRGADYFRGPSPTDIENTTNDEGDDDACLSNPRSIH